MPFKDHLADLNFFLLHVNFNQGLDFSSLCKRFDLLLWVVRWEVGRLIKNCFALGDGRARGSYLLQQLVDLIDARDLTILLIVVEVNEKVGSNLREKAGYRILLNQNFYGKMSREAKNRF